MSKLSRWIVLPLLAIAVIFFYSIGNTSTLFVFLILGFIFELTPSTDENSSNGGGSLGLWTLVPLFFLIFRRWYL